MVYKRNSRAEYNNMSKPDPGNITPPPSMKTASNNKEKVICHVMRRMRERERESLYLLLANYR